MMGMTCVGLERRGKEWGSELARRLDGVEKDGRVMIEYV
jgi:hypothetical protein